MGIFKLLDQLVDYHFKRNGLYKKLMVTNTYKIEYWSSDEKKPPMLLIHAFGADCKYSWFKQIAYLSQKYRLIIPNLLYFGASIKSPASHHINDQVDALKKLLEDLNINEFALGGASYGGVVACELANIETFKINKLFISNAPLKFSLQSDWEKVIADFGVHQKSEVLVPINHKQLYRLYRLSSANPLFMPSFVFKSIHRKMYQYNAKERRKLIDVFVDEHEKWTKKEYDFDFPILLIWGEDDKLNPLRIGIQLKEYFGENANLVILKNAGHLPNFDQPKSYKKALSKFLVDEK
mgnify:FL=1